MELRHLRYFVAVAEEEHMTRAAARLCIQQPPLSVQIMALEEELGVKLFTRAGKRIQLNPAGKLFLGEAREILTRVDDAKERVRRFDLGEEGRMRIGYTSSASLHQLTPGIIRAFRSAYPLISLEIEEGATHDLLCALEEERIDAAFVRSAVTKYTTLDSIELIKEDMVVAVPVQHALASARKEGLRLSDLGHQPFILYRQVNGSGIKEMLLEACGAAGVELEVVQEVRRIVAAIQLVAAGLGISVVPRSLNSMQQNNVVYRTFEPPAALTVPLSLAFRRSANAQAVRRFISLSQELAKVGE
ncbi:LysR family transcriptional regulator [Ramlibacter sp. AW1]|uniref:LysR family transcriptional regulator n=1 Tax=Ramlibacter aurantiacus TaxID=2801330 RepID=A0A936ZJS2_9BURK|nr:LysR family transcriptional regulator [Ramlibacter aurantiacus]MBL0422634.1 LysR family transcriptional regulator [Ramlibacter aurantiacus]